MITSRAFVSERGTILAADLRGVLSEPPALAGGIRKEAPPPAYAGGSDIRVIRVNPRLIIIGGFVSELDEAWTLGLAEAEARARATGRADIAEYIALRSSNDLIRSIASDWLLSLFASVAGKANRSGAAIQIFTEEAHRFKVGTAVMVGTRLTLERGVRSLIVEVGWPRTPRDGFIRGGGLACSNIKHLGIQPANEELRLTLNANSTPTWLVLARRGHPRELHETDVADHVEILLNDSRNPPKRS